MARTRVVGAREECRCGEVILSVKSNRLRMNIPSSGPAIDPEGVDGNIHTNWLV